MNHSVKVGFSFGITSGVITTLGLLVGLAASTNSKLIVLGGILTIAIADSFSDALGIHVSEESEGVHSEKEVWISTLSTWITKFIVGMSFTIPFLLTTVQNAVYISIVWGLLLLGIFSYSIDKKVKSVLEHLIIAILVIILTHYIGKFIATIFI